MKPMSPRYRCSVCGATTNLVFTYPRDPLIRKEWARILRTTWRSTIHLDWICGNHFADNAFSNLFKNRLKPNVLPLAPVHQFVRAPASISPWGPVRIPAQTLSFEYKTSELNPLPEEVSSDYQLPTYHFTTNEMPENNLAQKPQIKLNYPIRQVNDRRALNSDMTMVALEKPKPSDEVDAAVGLDANLDLPWTAWRNSSNIEDESFEDVEQPNSRIGGRLKDLFFKWKNKATSDDSLAKRAVESHNTGIIQIDKRNDETNHIERVVNAVNLKSEQHILPVHTSQSISNEITNKIVISNMDNDHQSVYNGTVTNTNEGSFSIKSSVLRELDLFGQETEKSDENTVLDRNDAINRKVGSQDMGWAIQYDMDLMKMAARNSKGSDAAVERMASFVCPMGPAILETTNKGAYPKHSRSQQLMRTDESKSDNPDRVWLGESSKT